MNMVEFRRCLILLLFSVISIIPFNYLQFITLSVGHWRLPFYYLVLGIPVLFLFVFALEEIKWFEKNNLFFLILVIYAGLIMSLFEAVNLPWAVRSLVSFSLRGPMVTIAMIPLYRSLKDIRKTMYFMAIIGIVLAGIGILEFICSKNLLYHRLYLTCNPYYPQVLDITNARGVMCGTIGHPLPFAAFLVVLLPVIITSTIFSPLTAKLGAISFVSAFLIAGACIYLSFSRSSWISAFICVALLFAKVQSNRFISINLKKVFAIGGVTMLTFILIHIFLPKVSPIFQKRVSGRMWWFEVFHSHRAASYTTTFNVLKKYPLWGVGFGNYPEIHEEFVAKHNGADPAIKTPDNQYLRWLADTGMVGFGCLVAFFVIFFKKLLRAYKKCPDEELKTLMWAIFCGIIGFMVNLMAFDGFFWMAPNFAFWMMLGLLAAAMRLAERKTAV